jgi:branched-chain amino acid aminotransferase
MNIKIERTKSPKVKPPDQELGFGQYFSDHMFVLDYDESKKWHNGRIVPYQNFQIDPAASVFHYGQALFEGMKAFRQRNGKIVLFKPSFNAERMQKGAERLCMQAPPTEIILEGLRNLVRADSDWVPRSPNCSLYLRPTLIGTEAFLGVRPSTKYIFFIICSPVGSYYSTGLKPVRIYVEDQSVRAAPGGLGATKAAANYAASLKAAYEAKAEGYAQVLWLDTTHQWIEEVGTMNVFFKIDGKIITPKLEGTILDGGIRRCVIEVLRKMQVTVEERRLSIQEVVEAHKAGKLEEAFGSGTAAVVTPIGELSYKQSKMQINKMQTGPLTEKILQEITAIQFGEQPDTYGWTEVL